MVTILLWPKILVTCMLWMQEFDLLFLSSGLEWRRRKFTGIKVTVTDLLLQCKAFFHEVGADQRPQLT